MYALLAANAKGTDRCTAVLEEDGILIDDDDDVVNKLEKNTVAMVINNKDDWRPPIYKSQGEQSQLCGNKNTEKDGNMLLEPTKLVNF